MPKPPKSPILRPCVKTHGGKWYLRNWIIGHFPANYEDMIFLEAFAGGASVLLNKRRSRSEFLCDIDTPMINLLRVIRDDVEKFTSVLKQVSYTERSFAKFSKLHAQAEAKANLNLYGKMDHVLPSEFDTAVWEYALRRMSRGGMRKAFAWSDRKRGGKPGDQNAWETMIRHLPIISQRLHGVGLMNHSFEQTIPLFDDKNMLMYLDPPYLHTTRAKASRGVYVHEMQAEKHETMLRMCVKSRSKILISGYDSKLYDDLLPGWNKYRKEIANHSSQSKTKQKKTEMLWTNYEPA